MRVVVGASNTSAVAASGRLLAIGLDQDDVAFLPAKVGIGRAEHIAAFFEPLAADSPL